MGLHNSNLYGTFRINRSRLSCRITCSFFHISASLPVVSSPSCIFLGTSDQLFLSIILAANDLYTILYPHKAPLQMSRYDSHLISYFFVYSAANFNGNVYFLVKF